MTAAYAIPATLAHVHLIAPRIRPADEAEVWASDRLRPAQALRVSMRGSDLARTLFLGGSAAAMFGVRAGPGVGIVWALTTDTVDRYPIAFWRASRHVVAELAKVYPVLVQCIDGRHEQALRWVRRLGFVVEDAHPCGPARLPFHQATFRSVRG